MVDLPISKALRLAVSKHKSGNLQEAERIYTAILKVVPGHSDANHNLGVLAVGVNKRQAALPFFSRAIESNPDIEQYWVSKVENLVKLGQYKVAVELIEVAKSHNTARAFVDNLNEILHFEGGDIQEGPDKEAVDRLLELYNQKKMRAAAGHAAQLVQKFPNALAVWNILGAANHDLNLFDEAAKAFKKVIALDKNYGEAHYNLGVVLQKLKRLNEAEASYTRAISINPEDPKAHNNLGNTLQELGKLDEAEEELGRAITLKPNYADALHNLAFVQNYMNRKDAEFSTLQYILQLSSVNHRLIAGVNLAILKFLNNDFVASKRYLSEVSAIRTTKAAALKNEQIYWNYLEQLLLSHDIKNYNFGSSQSDEVLYCIGESHSLVSHHLSLQLGASDFLCKAELIKGCTQWHLGRPQKNRYKYKFERIVSGLPKFSTVLLCIGEIDCRIDGGIIKNKYKYPEKSVEEIFIETIENFLLYVSNIVYQKEIKIIVQGVPCPNIDAKAFTEADLAQLVDLIKGFNFYLQKRSEEHGFKFLDVHRLTDRGDGFSNAIWHIDTIHLSPEGFLEAWRRYAFKEKDA